MNPFLVIYCKTKEEKVELLELVEQYGYKWNGDGAAPTSLKETAGMFIYLYKNEFGRVLRYASSCNYVVFVDYDYIKIELPNML